MMDSPVATTITAATTWTASLKPAEQPRRSSRRPTAKISAVAATIRMPFHGSPPPVGKSPRAKAVIRPARMPLATARPARAGHRVVMVLALVRVVDRPPAPAETDGKRNDGGRRGGRHDRHDGEEEGL